MLGITKTNMKRYIFLSIFGILAASIAYAQSAPSLWKPVPGVSNQIQPYNNFQNVSIPGLGSGTFCLHSVGGLLAVTTSDCSSGGGSGSGSVSTSSPITVNNFPYWVTAGGGLAGTSTLTQSGGNINVTGTLTVTTTTILLSQLAVGTSSVIPPNSLTPGTVYIKGSTSTANNGFIILIDDINSGGMLLRDTGGNGTAYEIGSAPLGVINANNAGGLQLSATTSFFVTGDVARDMELQNSLANGRLILINGSNLATNPAIVVSSTINALNAAFNQSGGIATLASTTITGQATTTNLSVTAVTNALGLFGSGGALSAYGGASNPCAINQSPTTISAVGALGGCTATLLAMTTSSAIANTQVIFGTGVATLGSNSNFTINTTSGVLAAPTGTFSGTVSVGTTTISPAKFYINGDVAINSSTDNGLLSVVNSSGVIALQVTSSTTPDFVLAATTSTATTTLNSSNLFFGISSSGIPYFNGTTTVSLGGSALGAGACTSTATTVGVLLSTSTDQAFATPQNYPGADTLWHAYISRAGTTSTDVTTEVCEPVAATPTASKYNISWWRNIGL